MLDLFMLEPEKYWDFTAKYTPEEKEREIRNRILSGEYIASLKKDGDYNRPTKYKGEVRLITRSLSTVTGEYGRKEDHVPYITGAISCLPDDTVLVGELYYPGKTSQDVATILRCKADKAAARQETKEYGRLHLYLHDIWFYCGQDLRNMPYQERINVLEQVHYNHLRNIDIIEIAQYAKTPQEITELLEYAFENGEEGIVMVRKDATVAHGKRTAWKTIKVKKELQKEVDCVFTGNYKDPTMRYTGLELDTWQYWVNDKTDERMQLASWYDEYIAGAAAVIPVTKPYYYGWAGSLELGVYHNGQLEVLGYISGVTDDMKEDYVANPEKWKLRPVAVTAMQFTEDNKLRHPRFVRLRDDLSPEDCTWEKIFG